MPCRNPPRFTGRAVCRARSSSNRERPSLGGDRTLTLTLTLTLCRCRCRCRCRLDATDLSVDGADPGGEVRKHHCSQSRLWCRVAGRSRTGGLCLSSLALGCLVLRSALRRPALTAAIGRRGRGQGANGVRSRS